MKVLFIARNDLFINIGGDTIQVNATAKYLKKLGVMVDIKLSHEKIDYTTYTLIHYFNIIDPEDILGHIYKSKKPYVVSTIYVDYSEFDKNYRNGLIGFLAKYIPSNSLEYFKTLAKFILNGEKISTPFFFIKGHKKSIKFILKKASCILPNSQNEYQRLLNDFGVNCKYEIIPNAVDLEVFKPVVGQSRNENLLLCVARLEGLKNQLNLIKAMKNLPYNLLLIGKESPNQKSYLNECKLTAGSNVKFIPFLPQSELINYYAQAKVHVLPSWFETTGLSSLEAAAMGCNIVVTDKGDVREYFGDLAFYGDPGNPESIAKAINLAMKSPVNEELQQKVMQEYSWEKAAEKTLMAYNKAIKND